MASKSVTLNSDVSQCSICLEEFTQPKFLDCFHTFCMECIRDLNQTSPGTVCCPLCQRQVQLPAGGVEQLTSNFYIMNINTDNNCNCKSTSMNSITTNSTTTDSTTSNSNIKKHERGTQTVESEINCSRQSVYFEYNNNYSSSFSIKNVEFDGVPFDLHPGLDSSNKWGQSLYVRIQISKSSNPFVKSCDIDYDISLVNQKEREYSVRQTGSCNLVRNRWSNQIYLIKWYDANDKDNCFYHERDEINDKCRIAIRKFQLDVGIKVKNKTMTNFDLK